MPRLEFSTGTQRAALTRSRGICECHRIPYVFKVPCGRPLGAGNTFFEHIVCDAIKPDNSLGNAAVLTKTCFNFKTASYDLPTIAKAKRVYDLHNNIQDPWKRRLPGGKKDRLKKTIAGPVLDRRTNEPVRLR